MTWLQGFARRLVADPDAAADLSQDTLVAAIEHSPRGLHGSRLRAWLARVARNFASRRMRDEDVRRDHEHRRALEPGTLDERLGSRSSEDAERLELQHALAGFLLGLPESYRDAVLLRYQHELSYDRVAAELGISEVAARQRVSRGLARLRERLDGRFGGRAAWGVLLGAPRAQGSPVSPIAAAWLAGAVGVVLAGWWWLGAEEGASTAAAWPERPPASRAVTDADDAAFVSLEPWLGTWRAEAPFEREGAFGFERGLDGKSLRMTRSVLVDGAWTLESEGLAGWHYRQLALVFHEFTRDAGSVEVMKEGIVYFTPGGAMVREFASFDPDGSSRAYREVFEPVGTDVARMSVFFEDDGGAWIPFGEFPLRRMP